MSFVICDRGSLSNLGLLFIDGCANIVRVGGEELSLLIGRFIWLYSIIINFLCWFHSLCALFRKLVRIGGKLLQEVQSWLTRFSRWSKWSTLHQLSSYLVHLICIRIFMLVIGALTTSFGRECMARFLASLNFLLLIQSLATFLDLS